MTPDNENPLPEEFVDGTIVGDTAAIAFGDDDKAEVVEMDVIGFSNDNVFSVQPIEDFDQFVRDQAAAEAAAIERMTDEQRELGWGSKWLRFVHGEFIIHDPAVGDYAVTVLPIFGRVATHEWMFEHEPEVVERYEQLLKRGYVWGWCSSMVVPDGEIGTTHASTIAGKLTDAQFEEAKSWGWDPVELAERTDWFLQIAARS